LINQIINYFLVGPYGLTLAALSLCPAHTQSCSPVCEAFISTPSGGGWGWGGPCGGGPDDCGASSHQQHMWSFVPCV